MIERKKEEGRMTGESKETGPLVELPSGTAEEAGVVKVETGVAVAAEAGTAGVVVPENPALAGLRAVERDLARKLSRPRRDKSKRKAARASRRRNR